VKLCGLSVMMGSSPKLMLAILSITSLTLLSFMYHFHDVVKMRLPSPKRDQDYPENRTFCNHPIDYVGNAPFPDIVLAINFNHPFYHNIPTLERYFEPLFPNYLFCGPEADKEGGNKIIAIPQPRNEYGYYGFQCLVEAIRRKPGFSGYFYVNDDMIINWWNLLKLDKTKVWFPSPTKMGQHKMLPTKIEFWWRRAACLERCSKAFVEMESDPTTSQINATKTYLENVGNKRVCCNALSDIVYIPGRLAKSYEIIAQKFYDNRVFLEVSTPMNILMLDKRENIVDIEGLYLQTIYGWGPWTKNTDRAWLQYNYKTYFLHPYKLSGEDERKNSKEFEERVIVPSEHILKDKCLDILDRGKFWT